VDDLDKLGYERALASLEAIDRVRDERRRNNGINYYTPNPLQMKLHKSKARTIMVVTGNRGGKSTGGAAELVFHLTGKYPDYFASERRFKKPVKAVVSATTFKIIDRVIEPKIRSLIPQSEIASIKRSNKSYLERLEMKNGSSCDFLTLDMDDMAYESADWDFAWLDEPQSQRKWQAIARGLLDRQGQAIFTFTPLIEPWMKDELFDKADGKYIDIVQGTTRDNLFDVEGNAILSEDAIRQFEETLPEELRDTRIGGKFLHLKGAIYKEFGPEHCLDEIIYQYPDPVICVLDPHDRQPHHVIWAFIDRTDDVYVDYEISYRGELDDLARVIRHMEKSRGYRMVRRIIDPNFGNKPARAGSNFTVRMELAKHGTPFAEGIDNIDLGHSIVRDYLHYNKSKPITASNKPKVFFSRERAPLTIKSMRNLQYEEWTGTTADKKDPREDERAKNTHGAACMRYLLTSNPRFKLFRVSERKVELESVPY